MAFGTPSLAAAALVSDLIADRSITATGDILGLQLRLTVTTTPVADLRFAYAIPVTARYVPESITLGGLPIPDSDSRISVRPDSIVVSIASVPVGTTTVGLRLRTTGPIGQPLKHDALLGAAAITTQKIRGYPTWIEDENATAYTPALLRDTHVSEIESTFNYGASTTLELRTGNERRAILMYDLASVVPVLPAGWEVQSARLELWPTVSAGSSIWVHAHAAERDWTEGTQVGAPCTGGATWRTRNCSTNWDMDSDFDNDVAGFALVDANTTFIAFDMRSQVDAWLKGSTTNRGFSLVATAATSGRTVTLPSREGRSSAALSARLVIVIAPTGTYAATGVKDAKAEILPNAVITNFPNQQFAYTLKPTFSASSTGMNRVTITVPSTFTLVAVDSVRSQGQALAIDTDLTLADGEFDDWSSGNKIDVRFSPPITRLSTDPHLTVTFRAATPTGADAIGKDFTAVVDHDRRGYAPQAAVQGNANEVPGDSDTWRVTTVLATLLRVDVTPTDAAADAGDPLSFQATAVYSNLQTADVTSSATWAVDPTLLGTFGPQPGVLHTQEPGNGSVTATYSAHTSTPASVTVRPPRLDALWIDPNAVVLAAGRAQQLAAFGAFSDGDTLEVTASASWSVENGAVATFDAPGLVRGLATGSTKLQANWNAVDAIATCDVTPAELDSITVTPSDTTVALGFGAQLRAHGSYSDGSTSDLTSVVTWAAAPPTIVDVDAEGRVTTLAQGTATIQASLGSITSANARFHVAPPALVGLVVSPSDTTVALGNGAQMRATGTYSDGSTANLSSAVTWLAAPAGIIDIQPTGAVTTLAEGTATVQATQAAITSAGATFHVDPPEPVLPDSLALTPRPLRLPPGAGLQLTATAYYPGGITREVNLESAWSASDSTIASVDSLGFVRANSPGSGTIDAVFGAVAAVCSIEVDVAALDSLVIVPADTTLRRGDSTNYRAFGATAVGSFDLTASVDWSVADTLVASLVPPATILARAVGSTTVHAVLGSVNATPATLQVVPPVLVLLEALPASSTLRLGHTKVVTARATYSDASTADVTASSQWSSDLPGIVYVDATGLATALALGTARIVAQYGNMDSSPAVLTVLPAVQLDVLPTGSEVAAPGATERLVHALRFTNRYTDVRRLVALRFSTRGPMARIHLRLDDGDGIFEPTDPQLGEGVPSGGQWTASGLALDLPVGAARVLFASADVSLVQAARGDTLDAAVDDPADLHWSSATAAVTLGSFPLQSPGAVSVDGLVFAQMQFTSTPGDSVLAGTSGVPVFECRLPDDGGGLDALQQLAVNQIGTARDGSDVVRLRLQAGPSPWTDVGTLVPTGGGRWSVSGLDVTVPAGGLATRIVADLAPAAESGRTIRIALPVLALAFASGRIGPLDTGWTNPNTRAVQSLRVLAVTGLQAGRGDVVPRHASRVPVLALELLATAGAPDALLALHLTNASSGPDGPLPEPNLELESAELWLDADANGEVGGTDSRLESIVPAGGGRLDFGAASPLDLQLLSGVPVRLLVLVTPDSMWVRDAELLAVRLDDPADVVSSGALGVRLEGELETFAPSVVDGQAASGYDVHPVPARLLPAGSPETVVLDLALPSNGLAADVLQAVRVRNAGTVAGDEVAALRLRLDDSDGVFDGGDAELATLQLVSDRVWDATGLSLMLPPGVLQRVFVTLQIGPSAQNGHTFDARIPSGRITVASGNDGPNDGELQGGGAAVVTAANQVIWVAGIAGNHAVRPDVRLQPVLVLETLNGYSTARTLTTLVVELRGTASEAEFDTWELHSDANQNGSIDPEETALATASSSGGQVRFESFRHTLLPLEQQRLLVTYGGVLGAARDGSTIDAAVASASSFGYAPEDGATVTAAQFELNSSGHDVFDGCVARQVGNVALTGRTLGGAERDVLALDLLLPANGSDADVLQELEVQIAPLPGSAVLGPDVEAVRLWAETDADPTAASFDPASDLFLGSVFPGASELLFSELAVAILPAGRRVYVTVDLAPAPNDGRVLQLRVPLNGIQVSSGNDGPVDEAIAGTATHRISTSQILASVATGATRVSIGQTLDVRIVVQNRGTTPLSNVVLQSLEVVPARPGSLIFGPEPASLSLAGGQVDTFACQYRFAVAGAVRFDAVAALPDSSIVAALASSGAVTIEHAPSALILEPLSSVPGSVYRGQGGLTPVLWRLHHADADSFAAPIEVRALSIRVEDGSGTAQSAAAVFDRLEVRTGSVVLAVLDAVPDSAHVRFALDPFVEFTAGETRDLALVASIAANAPATSFRLKLEATGAVEAFDANAGTPVALGAPLPWTSPAVSVRSVATTTQVAATPLLPARINQGQRSCVAARLQFTVPGAPGVSEVRLTQIALDLRRPDGSLFDLAQTFERFIVASGTTHLLETAIFDTTAARLVLPLTIAKTITSGAPENVDLAFDLRADAALDSFTLALVAPGDLRLVDAVRGTAVEAQAAPPDSFPLRFGATVVQSVAGPATVAADSRTPASMPVGAVNVRVADMRLFHAAPPGSAALEFSSWTFRTLDETGAPLVPRGAIAAARLFNGTTLVASTTSPPDSGSTVRLVPPVPMSLAAGDSLDLALLVDLAPAPTSIWLRFALDATAFDLRDANEPTRSILPTGSLPFATGLLRMVARPASVAFGPVNDPPANAPRAAQGFATFEVRVQHPGTEAETELLPRGVMVLLRDVSGASLEWNRIAAAARLRSGATTWPAVLASDSLRVDLAGAAPLAAGETLDLVLELDFLADPSVSDVRFGLDAAGLNAEAGNVRLPVIATSGQTLPYLSPAVHLASPALGESFANYPNPFAAGREPTRITFNLPADARVTIDIHTLSGERVTRILDAAPLAAGLHDNLAWDGRNGHGEVVRNGTYLLRLLVDGPGGGKFLRKLAVLR